MKRLGGAAAVGLAVAFLWADPANTLHADLLRRLVAPAIVAIAALWAAIGAGGALLRVRAPRVLDEPAGWLFALGIGVGLQGAAMLLLAAFGAAKAPGSAGLLLALACGWITRPGVRWPWQAPSWGGAQGEATPSEDTGGARLPWAAGIGGVGILAIAAVFLFPAFVEALAPPTDTDEMYYHLAIARQIAETGHMIGGFVHPDGSRPLPVHLALASLYAVGGETAPRLWHLALVGALVLGVRELAEARFGRGRGVLPCLALLGSWSFVREAGMAYNNHAVALWLLLGAEALLRRRWALTGWMCGLALAGKYTAAPVVAGMGLVAAWDLLRAPDPDTGLRRPPGAAAAPLAAAGLGVLAPVVPWWIRNVLDGLHPLFPFAGWPSPADAAGGSFVFMYAEKYGLGHAVADAALLPWNLLMRAEPDSFVFLGRISLLWAALVGAGLLAARRDPAARRLAVVVVLGGIGWAMGAQLLRYLLPVAGVAALLGGALRPAWPALLLWLVALPANVAPAWSRAEARVAVARGAEDRDTFLERELGAWPALRFLRDNVPDDAGVALLYAWQGYYVRQPYVLGSVEDHIPTRWWLWSHGDASLSDLAAGGVEYLLVGDVLFLKKSYPFLPSAVLDAQFRQPGERMRELLLRDATRLFAENRWEVWRLDPPAADAPPDAAHDPVGEPAGVPAGDPPPERSPPLDAPAAPP